jgi:hypothetical protein
MTERPPPPHWAPSRASKASVLSLPPFEFHRGSQGEARALKLTTRAADEPSWRVGLGT